MPDRMQHFCPQVASKAGFAGVIMLSPSATCLSKPITELCSRNCKLIGNRRTLLFQLAISQCYIYFRFYSFAFVLKAADFQVFIAEFVLLLVTGTWNCLAIFKIILLEII